jgi:hypothetical protein
LATAVSEWSAAAESRRRRKTASTLRAVTTATRDATGAFAEGAGDEDEDGEELEAFEDTPEALEAAYEDEASRLAAAEAAIAAAVKSISRRKTAVERDSKAAAEVREHAAAQKSAADEREARVEKVAEAVRLALEERCAQSHLDECESLANHVDMLGRESLRLWSDLIGRWADFVRKATAEVAMGYVTVVDASTQCAQDLIEENHKIAAAKAAAQANNHGIGGMLSDAAEFVASEAGLVGGSSPAAPGSSGGGLGSLRDRMREQSKKAMSTMNSLGGNLSHTLQGATGGFGFTRFKGGKDEKGEVADRGRIKRRNSGIRRPRRRSRSNRGADTQRSSALWTRAWASWSGRCHWARVRERARRSPGRSRGSCRLSARTSASWRRGGIRW